uniref:Uncharacterized protein n=1 Tax=Arundo donax TaxID=35708 RepID=A0A0A9FSN5_ARUDO
MTGAVAQLRKIGAAS